MPDEKAGTAGGEAQQRPGGVTLQVSAQDVKTSYANMCLLINTREELIMDFGLTLVGGQPDQRQANMTVSNRIIMGMPAAKRLAIALSQAVHRYENSFGVIDLEAMAAGPQKPSQ